MSCNAIKILYSCHTQQEKTNDWLLGKWIQAGLEKSQSDFAKIGSQGGRLTRVFSQLLPACRDLSHCPNWIHRRMSSCGVPTVGHSPPTTRDTVFVSVAANDGLSGGKCFSWVRSLFPPGLITCGNCGVSLPEKGRVLIGRNGFPRGGWWWRHFLRWWSEIELKKMWCCSFLASP